MQTSDFNPHPLWRGRPAVSFIKDATFCISIHTLCEEGDGQINKFSGSYSRFQSTPSVKRATLFIFIFFLSIGISIHTLCEEGDNNSSILVDLGNVISIHTLCEEGDFLMWFESYLRIYFNPHPLWRGRLYKCKRLCVNKWYFNPHPLWRGRCQLRNDLTGNHQISIHTLCEEGDTSHAVLLFKPQNFNPHPLWRGRLPSVKKERWYYCISIHTLCEEGDRL